MLLVSYCPFLDRIDSQTVNAVIANVIVFTLSMVVI